MECSTCGLVLLDLEEEAMLAAGMRVHKCRALGDSLLISTTVRNSSYSGLTRSVVDPDVAVPPVHETYLVLQAAAKTAMPL